MNPVHDADHLAAEPAPGASPERIAGGALRGPLTVAVVVLCLAQLATWVPHYLTWPWFIDHDVFATMARGWSTGQLPYRDLAGNNFPGTIYLFWIIGTLFGWGRTMPFHALDAALLLALGMAMFAWSRRCFGRALPGAIGYAWFLTYYLGQNYSMVAQRDWHGPLFVVLGLMAVESWPDRRGRWLAAAGAALGLVFRPQVVLLLPALALAVAQSATADGAAPGRGRIARTLLAWAALAGVLTALLFAPLVVAGIAGEFVRGVRLTAYGGHYNQVRAVTIARQLMLQVSHLEYLIVPAAIALLGPGAERRRRRSVRTWALALLGVWLYRPLSPVPWPYLSHPITLVLAVNVAVVVELLLDARRAYPAWRLVAVLLALAAGVSLRPPYCRVGASRAAWGDLVRGTDPQATPPGYIQGGNDAGQPPYSWADYRATLDYLRRATRPETRVANLLQLAPALTGPSGRLSALPAESLAWLVVRPDAESTFGRALGTARDAVVVWSPAEARLPESIRLAGPVRRLAPLVRCDYEPEARFGRIEVWRRKP